MTKDTFWTKAYSLVLFFSLFCCDKSFSNKLFLATLQDVERLKPHIVRSLANAEFYCLSLSVLYADPNFHNLNHWGIIQALARKGICVAEPSDCSLTETVLIQTTPLKMVMIFVLLLHSWTLFICVAPYLSNTYPRQGWCQRFQRKGAKYFHVRNIFT